MNLKDKTRNVSKIKASDILYNHTSTSHSAKIKIIDNEINLKEFNNWQHKNEENQYHLDNQNLNNYISVRNIKKFIVKKKQRTRIKNRITKILKRIQSNKNFVVKSSKKRKNIINGNEISDHLNKVFFRKCSVRVLIKKRNKLIKTINDEKKIIEMCMYGRGFDFGKYCKKTQMVKIKNTETF